MPTLFWPEFEFKADPVPLTPLTTVLPEIVALPVWADCWLKLVVETSLLVEMDAEFELEQLILLKDPGPVVEIDSSPQVFPVATRLGLVFSIPTVFEPWFWLTASPEPPPPVTSVLPLMVTSPLVAVWLEVFTDETSLLVVEVNRLVLPDVMMLVE